MKRPHPKDILTAAKILREVGEHNPHADAEACTRVSRWLMSLITETAAAAMPPPKMDEPRTEE